MSLDPVGTGLPPNLAAYVAGELSSLADDARTLKARLTTGDIVAAVVLPSNGLTDLIKIDGLRVAAELPPTVLPGDAIVVEVTGFSDDRILLHILPDTVLSEPAAAQPKADVARSAVARPDVAAGTPRASVTGRVPGQTSSAEIGAPRRAAAAVVATVNPQGARPATERRPPAAPFGNIEARLAAAHAMSGASAAPAQRKPAPAQAPLPAAPQLKPGSAAPANARPLIAQRVLAVPLQPRPAAAPAPAVTPRPPPTYTEPAALLRALQLPISASNLGAARMALESPERLAPALASLERALSAATAPHAATARTLLAFVARIEPRSPVLAAQIAAFVDHVVDGREPKLVQLLTAHAQAAPGAEPAGGAAAGAATGSKPVPPPASVASAGQPPNVEPASGDPFGSERVVLRQAALDTDLKTQLLAIAHDPSVARAALGGTESLPAALSNALAGLTALQLNAATALAANPDGLAFWLPVALPDGFARAQIQIDRKTPQAQNGALDGDNFHIAFVLETQHLGTVAIDLLTVGRSVSVGVKTESGLAQRAFGSALTQLQQRLEALHYRVARADADVAPRGITPVQPDVEPDNGKTVAAARLVDLDA